MTRLHATFVTLLPQLIESALPHSILARALGTLILKADCVQIRDFAKDNYQRVDDTPYGGGQGQVMRVDIVHEATLNARSKRNEPGVKQRVILMDPAAKKFEQEDAKRLSEYDHLIFVCGRYEGIDARIYAYVDEAFSIGDFVLTGGELASLVIFDATARHIPGVLGNAESLEEESHQSGLLEYSHYTRPFVYNGAEVPQVLAGGNHALIRKVRRLEQLLRTKALRPDLFEKLVLTKDDKDLLAKADSAPVHYPWENTSARAPGK